MFTRFKTFLSFGAGALALGLLILGAPRAAHAIAATLVQITNTTANPAITESIHMQASQLVQLTTPVQEALTPGTSYIPMHQVTAAGYSSAEYVVPAGQNLVITGIDVNLYSGKALLQLTSEINGALGISEMYLTNVGFLQIRNSSGFVFPSGSEVYLYDTPGYVGVLDANIHGYLTAN